jgi:hypothetical protein
MDSETREEIDALITLRIVEFHDAMVRRGQIPEPRPATGVTADYTENLDVAGGPSQRLTG